MLVTLAALLLGAAQGQDEAKELFGRMETQLQKCKTLQVDVDAVFQPGKDNSGKGSLVVTSDNKLRLNLELKLGGKAATILVVCDGKKILSRGAGPQDKVEDA